MGCRDQGHCLLLLAPILLYLVASVLSTGLKEDLVIYYNESWEPVPLANDTNVLSSLKSDIFTFGPLPCSCEALSCGCCVNMNISRFNFSRTGCTNFTYLPLDFAIKMDVFMNDETVYSRNVSAKNPPPACMEVPITYLPSIQFCLRFFDIYTPGRNLHVCMNFETKISRAPILVLEFDCVQMGVDGLAHIKPTETAERVQPGNSTLTISSDKTFFPHVH